MPEPELYVYRRKPGSKLNISAWEPVTVRLSPAPSAGLDDDQFEETAIDLAKPASRKDKTVFGKKKSPHQRLPKRATIGDHAVIYGNRAKPTIALLPVSHFGSDMLIFYYSSSSAQKWRPSLCSGQMAHHQACIDGESDPINLTLEGNPGELLIGRRMPDEDEQQVYQWTILTRDGERVSVRHEDTVVMQGDDPSAEASLWQDSESIEAIPSDERRAGAALFEPILDFSRDAANVRTQEEANVRLQRFVAAMENMAPGPVAGTLIPVDIATMVGDPIWVQEVCGGGNVMTGQFQSAAPVPAQQGFGGATAANGFLQSVGLVFSLVADAKDLVAGLGDDGSKAQRVAARTNITLDSLKLAKSLTEAISKVISLAGAMTTTAAQGVAGATGFLGTILGGFTAIRAWRKAWRTREKLAFLASQMQDDDLEADFRGCVQYAMYKLTSRSRKQVVTSVSAVLGAAGGTIITVTAIVGAANAWNPVGWAIIGAGTLVGVGVGAYILYRRYQRHKVRAARKAATGIKTPAQFAKKVWAIAHTDEHKNRQSAIAMIQNFKGDPNGTESAFVALAAQRFHK